MGFFDPVWPRSPYVENVKVFIRTPQRHFCTQPTHCSLRIRALPGGLWVQPRNKGFGFQGEPAGLRAEEFCGTGIILSCHPLVGGPVVSGVPGLRPEKSCRFKSPGCWLHFLIAWLWLTHLFWRTWISSFLRSCGTDGPSMRKCKAPSEVSQLQQGSCPATLGIEMALMPFAFHMVQVKGLWLGERPGRMPVGESHWSVQECLGCPLLWGPASRF